MAVISGVAKHPGTQVPGAYQIFVSDYYTGELIAKAVSDPTTGAYAIDVPGGTVVRVTRVNAGFVAGGDSLVFGLPMTGSGGAFEELVGGYNVSPYYVQQSAVAGSPDGVAAIFNADTKYIEIEGDARLRFLGPFSMGFKVVHDTLTLGYYCAWYGEASLACSSSGEATLSLPSSGDQLSLGTATAGVWDEVLITRDDAGVMRSFRAGVQQDEIVYSLPFGGNEWGSALLTIGRHPAESTTTFRGKMSSFFMADAAIHTADYTPSPGIPETTLQVLDVPFAASEIIDYVTAASES